MLKVLNLTKIYKSKKGADIRALDGVTLQFPDKGMVFLLGKSGSGKSTLLNVCGGLDYPTSGEIIVKGKSSKNFSQNDFDSYRNTYIGFIFQEYNILNEFTVEDNIALALELQGKSKDKEAINALLNDVDLQGYAKRKPNTLSGGQKQMGAIAGVLALNPKILILDEATSMLDPVSKKKFKENILRLKKEKNLTIISITHDKNETLNADKVIVMDKGNIVFDGKKNELYNIDLKKYNLELPSIIELQKYLGYKEYVFSEEEFLKRIEGEKHVD